MSEQEQESPTKGALTSVEEWVSVTDAAARLGIEKRALRRVIDHPSNEDAVRGQTSQETRSTRTGARTSTVYPFTLLCRLWNDRPAAKLSEHVVSSPPDSPQENEVNGDTPTGQKQGQNEAGRGADEGNGDTANEANGANEDTGGGQVFITDERTRAYLALLTKSYTDRIAEQAQANADLRQTVDELRADKARLIAKVDALEAIAPVPAGVIKTRPDERTGGTDTSGDGERGQVDAPTAEAATVPDISREIKRSWWQFWKGDS